jgi:hypothetical protein
MRRQWGSVSYKRGKSGTLRSVQKEFEKSSQKNQKSWKSLLTVREGPDYIRLTNDGGDAAGDEEVRFNGSQSWTKSREPRERHSVGPEAKSGSALDIASVMSVL